MKGMTAAPLAVAIFAAVGFSSAFADVSPQQAQAPGIAVSADTQQAQEYDDLAAKRVSRYGQIIGARKVGLGDLTAWTVEKNGHQIVLFSTGDSSVIFTGVAWDATTGQNISDAFLPQQGSASGLLPPQVAAPPVSQKPLMSPTEQPVKTVSAMDGEYQGEIPTSMKTVDSLAGFKEGDGDIANTVYIVIDPRCPYCRQAYNLSREYVKRGQSIKWIPSAALGNPQDGVPLAATILQSPDHSVLDRVLGKHEQIRSTPTPESIEALSTNLEFLFAAFKNNGREQAGVPAAFFIDHRTGKAKMLTGVSEAVVLEDIFGKL